MTTLRISRQTLGGVGRAKPYLRSPYTDIKLLIDSAVAIKGHDVFGTRSRHISVVTTTFISHRLDAHRSMVQHG